MKPLLACALLASGCLIFPVDDIVSTEHPECEDIHPDAVNVAKWKTRTIVEPFEDPGDACTVEECMGTFVDENQDPSDGCEKDGAT
jgi:hypothetical protein